MKRIWPWLFWLSASALLISAGIYVRQGNAEIAKKSQEAIRRDGFLCGKAGSSPDNCPWWRAEDRELWLNGFIEGKDSK